VPEKVGRVTPKPSATERKLALFPLFSCRHDWVRTSDPYRVNVTTGVSERY
jgi:hypothetical protein